MPERYARLLRLSCIALAGVLLVRLAWVVLNHNPLADLKIPSVPTLVTAESQSDTNAAMSPERTNKQVSTTGKAGQVTNTTAVRPVAGSATNAPAPEKNHTNPIARTDNTTGNTNSASATNGIAGTNLVSSPAATTSKTNSIADTGRPPTNAVVGAGSPRGTNSSSATAVAMMNPQRPGMPSKPRDLAPEIQARVDRVTDSEILGPVMRPLPMALLGIAGNVAFLRAANGQTGLVKEGEDLGGLKLIRIGINRVLVEQEGQKKELMMFSGLGGESLLTNETKAPP